MIKKILFFCVVINILNGPQAGAFTADLQSTRIQDKMKSLSNVDKMSIKVSGDVLPTPYNYLLTQPLMTKGIEKFGLDLIALLLYCFIALLLYCFV